MTQEELNSMLEELLSSPRIEKNEEVHEGDYSKYKSVADEIALMVRTHPSYIKYIKANQQFHKNKALDISIEEKQRLYHIGREASYAQILQDMLKAEKNIYKKEQKAKEDLQKT